MKELSNYSQDFGKIHLSAFHTNIALGDSVYNQLSINELSIDNHELSINNHELSINNNKLSIDHKIFIRDLKKETEKQNYYPDTLSIITIEKSDYDLKVSKGTLLSDNILYIVSSDYLDAYGQQLCNLTMTDDQVESEAATKHYIDNKLCGITVKLDVHELSINNNKLSIDNHELSINNHELSINNNKLSIDNHELSINNNKLSIDNHELSINNNKLSIDNHELSINNHELSINNNKLSIDHKIFIRDLKKETEKQNYYPDTLSIITIEKSDYDLKVSKGTLLSDNILYIVSSDYLDAYGQQLCNLTMTDDQVESEAATKHYIDNKLCGITVDFNQIKDLESITDIIKNIILSFGGNII